MFGNFYKDKRVLITGHTGFKGTWLTKILLKLGANVMGYSLEPDDEAKLFELSGVKSKIEHVIGDVRNQSKLIEEVSKFKPEIIFHLAAQPLVRESFSDPVYTYETNILGTLYLLDIIRNNDYIKSFINVTTDKVYKNNEWVWGYRENEELDGFDPYSNSKSCSELLTSTYIRSFRNINANISTVRAGNVIGGGDFSKDRIIPDCFRYAEKNSEILVRNPISIRPYQHVFEPLFLYLLIAKEQYFKNDLSGSYNVGPYEKDCISTGELVSTFCNIYGENIKWKTLQSNNAPHEANFLKLDTSKVRKTFGWSPIWDVNIALTKTILWHKQYLINSTEIDKFMDIQINEYMEDIYESNHIWI